MVLKANINALNLMQAGIGSQWINCRVLMELAGRSAKRALQ